MQRKLSPQQIKAKNKGFNQARISLPSPYFIPLDIKLTSNPFLKDQQKFQYILHQLKQYNKQIKNQQLTDTYQMKVYQKLFSMFTMLGTMNNRQIQIQRLDEIVQWYQKQLKLIEQRKDQGSIRYKVLKKDNQLINGSLLSGQLMQSSNNINENENTKLDNFELPSDILSKQLRPYAKNWRTAHKQLQVPQKRLKQYKRKEFDVAPFREKSKQISKAPRITYPKLQKIKWAKDDILQELNDAEKQLNDQPGPQNNQQQNQPQDAQAPANQENPQVQKEEPGVDLGLGQPVDGEPEQQQEEQPQQDKLAPRLKPYIYEPQQPSLSEVQSSEAMNKQYLKIVQKNIRKKHQDENLVKLMHTWALKKTQLNRQIHRRIDDMGINKRYSFSYEEPEPIERINPEDERRLGFSQMYKTEKVMKPSLDLSGDFELPKIKNKSEIYEKSIRKDRMKNLRKKFGKMLNLTQNQPRQEVSKSMCQYQLKRKGFSQVLKRNSVSKERIKQLDQVMYLKQKLARSKANIDVKSLSKALALHEQEDNLPTQAVLTKDLPNNPFWVQPKKKKKKK